MVKTNLNKGYVTQIIGPVLDIQFSNGNLPPIYSAIKIDLEDGTSTIVEVQQLLGDNKIRAVSMRSTDGLRRGVEALDLGAPISVPVGTPTLGRIFNVIGEPVDEQGDVSYDETLPIHRDAPAFTQLGFGILWKESDDIRVNISPVTGRIITANKKFTTTPGYVDGDFFGIDEGESIRTEFGASVNAFVKFKVMEGITVGNVLSLYSNYLEDPLNVDIDYTLNLIMSVNKYISANFTFQAIYDDNAVRGFQIREVLGVGLNYTF
jgi:hypothetical protein